MEWVELKAMYAPDDEEEFMTRLGAGHPPDDEEEFLTRDERVERHLADGFEFWQNLDNSVDNIEPVEGRDSEWNTLFELLCNISRTHNAAAGYVGHEPLEARKKAAAADLHKFLMKHVDRWVDAEMEE